MTKDGKPDWLNNLLWSITLSGGEDHIHCHSHSPTISPNVVFEPIIQPLVLVPPPATASSPQSTMTSPKSKSRDQVDKNNDDNSNDNDQNASSSDGSPDDISRKFSKKVVNLWELWQNASQGIPEGARIRSTVWKLLLGYPPPNHMQWSYELAKKRSEYKQFKEELLMNPTEMARKLEKSAVRDNDHSEYESSGLLSRSQGWWYFKDSEIIEQIDQDVKHTHPDMNFFSGNSQLAKSNRDALKDILIVFSKLNPGIRYVQGMNEILAPLFYVFRNDPDEEMALLSGFRDPFYKQLDNISVGIHAIITRLSQFLKEHDQELWRHLEITTKVHPQFYAFRWITLLLTQEFNFAHSLHIWDTLLSDPEGPPV
ncbi:Ypt/Rab-GAP domain of gyp1p superfamily protein isoform 2 [Hibiscus syriacus]|uniref:Ypt/Rab-GAP domain of gyp1p superfamily protein isoform 2 n=1 Tax=Hibiscus syriacus TaxID=106335 RepID=A0A6A3AKK2_HIBSY|nr:Ypt/Rab-GAP domain of gyp1p superfamily protein isoform 2 [Hibiscus syriacus]